MKTRTLDIAIIICSMIVIILTVVLALPIEKEKLSKNTKTNKEVNNEEKVNVKNVEDEIKENSFLSETTVTSNEDEVVSYVTDVESQISTLNANNVDSNMKEKLENTFITLTDFIFYGGTIKGMTFNQLTDLGKEKVLSLYEKIDSKIEAYFPNYKENIESSAKKGYTTVVTKAKELKNEILAKYKTKVGEEEYNNVVSTYEEDKSRFEDTYTPYVEKGKDIASSAIEKGKNVWNLTKDKLDSWYQNFKESRE